MNGLTASGGYACADVVAEMCGTGSQEIAR